MSPLLLRLARTLVFRFAPLFLALFFFCSLPAHADDTDSQGWIQFILNAKLAPRALLYVEAQPRFGDGYRELTQFAFRAALGYRVNPRLSLWQGYNWQPTTAPIFNDEHRLYQQALWDTPWQRLNITQRVRLEERFIEHVSETAFRLRHQVKLAYPLDRHRRWEMIGTQELFWNLNSTATGPLSGYDQDRLSLRLAWNTNRHLQIELGYVANFVNQPRKHQSRRLDALLLVFNFTL